LHKRKNCGELQPSGDGAVLLQQGDHVSDLLGVEGGGGELVAELNKIASILALSSASRAFSLLSCADSILSRSDSFSICADSFLSCSISLSIAGSRRQLSVCNHKRHRGNDEPDAPLLGDLEGGICREGDVGIGGKQGDEGDHDAAQGLEASRPIQT
jgi:hypothetical protein